MRDQQDGNNLQPATRPSLAAQAHLSYFGQGVADVEGHGCFAFAVLEGGRGWRGWPGGWSPGMTFTSRQTCQGGHAVVLARIEKCWDRAAHASRHRERGSGDTGAGPLGGTASSCGTSPRQAPQQFAGPHWGGYRKLGAPGGRHSPPHPPGHLGRMLNLGVRLSSRGTSLPPKHSLTDPTGVFRGVLALGRVLFIPKVKMPTRNPNNFE